MKVPTLPVKPENTYVPAHVHQVWVGGDVPDWIQRLWSTWRTFGELHEIEVTQWTPQEVSSSISARVGDHFGLSPVQVADLFRIEVVALRGGVYMDSDTVPIQPMWPFFGNCGGWLAHGQDWTRGGEPTVSNAMFGMPQGSEYMSMLFEHAVKALERGVTNTFDIAGPSAYRRLLSDRFQVSVAPEHAFPAYRAKQKRAEFVLGRQLKYEELVNTFPQAYAIHLSAESWVPGKLEKRYLDA